MKVLPQTKNALFTSIVICLLSRNIKHVLGKGKPAKVENNGVKDWWKTVSTTFPRNDETHNLLNSMQKAYTKQFKFYSIGKSVQGREMWVMKLAQDVSKEKPVLVPEVKIVANMHGDEVLGRSLILMLAVDILTKFSAKDKRIVNLLSATELHLMPSVNPDGFEASKEGECSPDTEIFGRNNANNVDLNRDFPYIELKSKGKSLDDLLKDKQPETKHMAKWITSNYFVLSANIHALTLVVNYPYDSVPPEVENDPSYEGEGIPSRAPDNEFFFHVSTLYATNHKVMSKTNNCSKNESFRNGVTNGAEWYNVKGGMQDFNYNYSNTFEITLELSCCKFPSRETLLTEWDNNREALYKFIEAAQMGVKGLVKDSEGKEIHDALIQIKGMDHPIKTTRRGEYWRLLAPGKYQIWEAEGHENATPIKIEIKKEVANLQDKIFN